MLGSHELFINLYYWDYYILILIYYSQIYNYTQHVSYFERQDYFI